jgi:hypothetical protein
MRERWLATLLLAGALALPGCKPPPSDAAMARAANPPALRGPSEPIASPDTTGAVWAPGGRPMELVYGVPGQPPLLSLACESAGTAEAQITITRHAEADRGTGALLALIGNGWIGRFPVDATALGGRYVWQGTVPAARREWQALRPEAEASVTVPGAGLVRLNPSPLPMQLIKACRAPSPPADRA